MDTIWILLVAGVAALAPAAWLIVRFLTEQEEQFYLFRCPACGKKLRYLARKAGREGVCPGCAVRCTFPSKPQPLELYPKGKPGRRIGRRMAQV